MRLLTDKQYEELKADYDYKRDKADFIKSIAYIILGFWFGTILTTFINMMIF